MNIIGGAEKLVLAASATRFPSSPYALVRLLANRLLPCQNAIFNTPLPRLAHPRFYVLIYGLFYFFSKFYYMSLPE